MTLFRAALKQTARLAGALMLAAGVLAPALGATITGVVFEDVNYGGGPGRSRAASNGAPIENARVELYRDNGTLVGFDYTDVNGVYSINTTGNGPTQASLHRVRVVNGTVGSSRGGCTTCVPVQTFRTEAPAGTAAPVTNEVGGRDPALYDHDIRNIGNSFPINDGSQTVQSWSHVDPPASNSTVSGIDFGFNFSTVVNTRDTSTNCTASGAAFRCQGGLRQFIINANALPGEGALAQAGSGQIDGTNAALPSGYESSIFMIPSGALSGGVATISLAGALPPVVGANTRLDATTQTVNIGNTNSGSLGTGGTVGVDGATLPTIPRPEVQLSAGNTVLTLSGANTAVLGFALRQGYIQLSGVNGLARNNAVGMTAGGSSNDNSAAAYGISFSAPNVTIRNNFVTVNNSGIRSDGGGANALITQNEVARPTYGHTNTFDGILLINGASNVQITNNLVRNQAGGAIELGFGSSGDSYTNVLVANNTVRNNGYTSGSSASSEPIGMVAYNLTGSNVSFYRNLVADNAGPGLVVLAATGVAASQNRFENNGGLAIDLDPNTRDPNSLGAPNGVTLNDAGDADGGPNALLNYPVITSATIINGELSIAGYARPNSSIELYLAQPDTSGFGEGQIYFATLTEGAAADLDSTTGSYGPAAINGRSQGADNTNRFLFRMPAPGGVSVGSILSSTATLAGQTSEFGGNVIVSGGPSLQNLKSVAVLSDPFNGSTNPKSIPGSIQVYTVRITNQGSGGVDTDTLTVTDAIPANTAMYVADVGGAGSGPLAFVDGSPGSALAYSFSSLGNTTDSLDFSNNGGATWTYAPTPDANGCDPAVTHIRVRLQGAMAGAGGSGNPSFELRFRVRVN